MIKNVGDLEKILGVKLTEKQQKVFYRKETYLLWGGSSAAGKSFLLSFIALYYALKYDGAICLIGRKFQSSLTKTTQISFENLIRKLPKDYLKRRDKTYGFYEFANGSRIYFVGLSDSHDSLEKLRGIELIFAGVDECQDFDDDSVFIFLTTRLRQKIEGAAPKLLMTCNPNRKKWIIEKWISGRKRKDFCFIRALPKDNKQNLPRNYLRSQKSILPELQYQILILGSWEKAQIEDCLFKREKINESINREDFKPGGISYGIDVSLKGVTIIARKSGNRITLPIVLKNSNIDEFMTAVEEEIKDKGIPIYIDAIGEGAGICVVLEREKYNVIRVVQNESALDYDKYFNLRSENYDRLNLMLPELILPDDRELRDQMLNCRRDLSREGKLKIQSKVELHHKNQSPHKLDAVVLSVSGEGKEESKFFEDERGAYELENGKKVYLINYSSNISVMVKKGRIGECEILYDPKTISDYDKQRLVHQGFIRSGWEERRKEFMGYVEKYERTGRTDWNEGLKFRH